MAGESIGWGCEFWLHNGSTLVQLDGVFDMTPPDEQADDVEITHYKSAGKKREYIQGLIETGEGVVQMNYVPLNATDVLCRAAKDAGDTRAFKMVLSDAAGDPLAEIDGFCYVKGYKRNIPVDDRKTAELTVKFTGDSTDSAA